jgi:hypothetical protein
MDRRTIFGFVLVSCLACGTSSAPSAPSASPPAATRAWSGTVAFSSAEPADSCEARYVATHPEVLAQTATADLNVNGTTAGMTLTTETGQECGFQGSESDGVVRLATRHELCRGYPLISVVLAGIAQSCHTIDPIGDGPYWGDGVITGRMTSSQMDGHWISRVYDPGGGSYGAMSIAIDMEVHFSHR